MVVKCGFETTLNMLNAIFKYSIGGCGICKIQLSYNLLMRCMALNLFNAISYKSFNRITLQL